MEEIIKALIILLGPTLSSVLGFGVLGLIVIPYIIKIWESWVDARAGRRASDAERARLELVKLWLEIEALKKEHQLELPTPLQPPLKATLRPSPSSRVDASIVEASAQSATPDEQPRLWRWLSELNARSRILSVLVIAVLSIPIFYLSFFGLVLTLIAFSQINGAPANIAYAAIVTLVDLGLLYAARSLYRQYNSLKAEQARQRRNIDEVSRTA